MQAYGISIDDLVGPKGRVAGVYDTREMHRLVTKWVRVLKECESELALETEGPCPPLWMRLASFTRRLNRELDRLTWPLLKNRPRHDVEAGYGTYAVARAVLEVLTVAYLHGVLGEQIALDWFNSEWAQAA